MLTLTDEQLEYLEDPEIVVGSWWRTPNGINVDGDVRLWRMGLTSIPVKFYKVTGSFSCCVNRLFTLDGCPQEVGREFSCRTNNLMSLAGGPKIVKGKYFCHYNKIHSYEELEGVQFEQIFVDSAHPSTRSFDKLFQGKQIPFDLEKYVPRDKIIVFDNDEHELYKLASLVKAKY